MFVMTQPFDPHTGGIQMSTWKIGSWLAQAGHSISAFSFARDGHQPMPFGELHHAGREGSCSAPANIGDMLEVINSFKPDVVINQTPYDFPIGGALQPLRRDSGPLILACLRNSLFSVKLNLDDYRRALVPARLRGLTRNRIGNWGLQLLHRHRHSAQLRTILDHHDKFVLFGPPNHDEIEYFIGTQRRQQLPCIPNSIPSVATSVPSKEKVLLYVGRLSTHQKRAELLLPLWNRLHRELADWEFHIVGDGPYRKEMEKNVRSGRIPRVVFHGKQDPYPHYERAGITVMTSSFEGFPNVTIEAQSRGAVPVLMDSFPLASWVVNHQHDALLIPPFELSKMAESIRRLAHDKGTRERMQSAALENARRFHIDTVGKQWLDLFDTAAA
jgi:glycosyltransferase involved in cell wall biosynthesis